MATPKVNAGHGCKASRQRLDPTAVPFSVACIQASRFGLPPGVGFPTALASSAKAWSRGGSPVAARAAKTPSGWHQDSVSSSPGFDKARHQGSSTAAQRGQLQRASSAANSAGGSAVFVHEPLSPLDVDKDLWEVLDICSDDELEALYTILHSSSPFSPLVKSLVTEREPALLEQRGRRSIMHKIESRFRFLAASPADLLQGTRPSYRQTLLDVRDKLGVNCSRNLSTFDLETELFLHLLNDCVEYVQSDEASTDPIKAAAIATLSGDESGADGTEAGFGAVSAASARRTPPAAVTTHASSTTPQPARPASATSTKSNTSSTPTTSKTVTAASSDARTTFSACSSQTPQAAFGSAAPNKPKPQSAASSPLPSGTSSASAAGSSSGGSSASKSSSSSSSSSSSTSARPQMHQQAAHKVHASVESSGGAAASAAGKKSSTSSSGSGSSSGTTSSNGATSSSGSGNWTERVTAPLRFGVSELMPLMAKLGGVAAVTQVGRTTMQQLATNLMCSHLKYQAAVRAASGAAAGLMSKGAAGAAAAAGKTAVVEAAQQGLAHATARYAAARSALSLLGPLMWGWLAADLALKAIGTDYARVVRAVFILAQVRLVRTRGFVNPDLPPAAAAMAAGRSPGQQQQYNGQQDGGTTVPASYRMCMYGFSDEDEEWIDPGAAFSPRG